MLYIFYNSLMRKFLLFLLVVLVVIYGCSPSVGRKVVKTGEFDVEISLGGAFFKYTFVPLPLPNLGVGMRYGIVDNLNVGIKVFPLYVLFNTLQITPYGVVKIYESQQGWIPSVNVYSEINSLVYLSPIQGVFYPLVGVSSVWGFNWGDVYLPLEVSFDFYNDRRPVKFNLGIGANIFVFEKFDLAIELRVNSIGNIYLPLGNMVGVPALFVSGSYKF